MAKDHRTEDHSRAERRASTLQQVANDFGISLSTVKRGVSHSLIKVIYFGDRPLVPVEEQDRLQREGLPKIPSGYKKRVTARPVKKGRKLGTTKAVLAKRRKAERARAAP